MLSQQVACAFVSELKLNKGDRIGFILPNIPEFPIAVHASLLAGAVVTFANPLYTVDEITRQFESAQVKCIVTVPPFRDAAVKVSTKLKNYTKTISIGDSNQEEQKLVVHTLLIIAIKCVGNWLIFYFI